MIRQGKVWGWTKPIYLNDSSEIHEVMIKKDGYCSRHSHIHKYNQFYVFAGKLKIIIWKDYGTETLEDVTILTAGESCVVPPGDEHRFLALEDTHALEIYYVKLNPADISRVDHGGMNIYAEKADFSRTITADRTVIPKGETWDGTDCCGPPYTTQADADRFHYYFSESTDKTRHRSK